MESISFIWRKVINLYEPRLLTSVMVYNGVRGICPSDHNPTCTSGDAPRGIRTVLYFRNLDIYELKTEAPMHDALGPFNCPQLRHKTDTVNYDRVLTC